MKPEAYRQGDIILKPTANIPPDAMETKETVLAYGEATGHAHRIKGDAKIYQTSPVSAKAWIKSLTGFEVEHEEHETIQFPAGTYEFYRQKEYDWVEEAVRYVTD